MSNKRDLNVTEEDMKKFGHGTPPNAVDKEMQEIQDTLSGIKHKIIVCSGKGGVGKSTVSTNLALALAAQGKTVGLLDVDITGPNIPKMLGIEGIRPEIDQESKKFIPILHSSGIKLMSMAFLLETPDSPVIWRGPMKMKALRQFIAEGKWGHLDYLIADLPPGTSDETLDIMQLTKGKTIIVSTPQDVALLDARKTVVMAQKLNLPIAGIIENMSGFSYTCPNCEITHEIDLFGKDGGKNAAENLGVNFLGSIPIDLSVREGGDEGRPFLFKNPDSIVSKSFFQIVENLKKFLGE